MVDERDNGMAEGGTVDDGGGAEAGVGAAEGALDSEVETAVLMGAGAGALAVRVGTTDGGGRGRRDGARVHIDEIRRLALPREELVRSERRLSGECWRVDVGLELVGTCGGR